MPRWRDIKRFCENDGWELYKQTDHYFYDNSGGKAHSFRGGMKAGVLTTSQKLMPGGTLKRTKISMDSGEVSGHLWEEILKRQLQVTRNISMARFEQDAALYR
jgi:hypothetical protein